MTYYYVVYPSSEFRRKWDILSMSMLLYVALFTPFQIAFLGDIFTNQNIPDWWFIFIIDRLVDLVFIVDLGVNFRSAWIDDDGHEQFSASEARPPPSPGSRIGRRCPCARSRRSGEGFR